MAITTAKQNKRRYKLLITIVAGTPVFLATTKLLAERVLIQMQAGGSGMGYVYDDIPDGASAAQVAAGADLAVQLAPAEAAAPGGAYQDSSPTGGIDLSGIAVDGANSGDTVLVDAYLWI